MNIQQVNEYANYVKMKITSSFGIYKATYHCHLERVYNSFQISGELFLLL